MEKLKKIVSSSLFKTALAAGAGIALIIKGEVLYAGLAFGIGIREFLLAFKSL